MWNVECVARGVSLIAKVKPRDAGGFTVPDPRTEALMTVRLGKSGVCCSCGEWNYHHTIRNDFPMADPTWVCVHGAAVLLKAGRSDTYLDWKTLPAMAPQKMHHEDFNMNQRRFDGVIRNNARRFALAGIDRELIEAYFAKINGVGRIEARIACLTTAVRKRTMAGGLHSPHRPLPWSPPGSRTSRTTRAQNDSASSPAPGARP